VLWSDHPLSNFARAEQTWIEGRKYFDREEDRSLQALANGERERLIQSALVARSKALALSPDAEKNGNATPASDAAPPDPGLIEAAANDPDWVVHRATQRGLYHSGADLMSCGIQDHAH
jgi:hypothetical protein